MQIPCPNSSFGVFLDKSAAKQGHPWSSSRFSAGQGLDNWCLADEKLNDYRWVESNGTPVGYAAFAAPLMAEAGGGDSLFPVHDL
jgi:hypothetical protein